MILQTDRKLRHIRAICYKTSTLKASIHNWGCYLMCIIYITAKANDTNTKSITPKHVIDIYKKTVENNYMGTDCFVEDPTCVSKTTSEVLGVPKYCEYTGVHSQQFKAKDNQFILGRWAHKLKHFVVMDGFGGTKHNVIYDSLGFSHTVMSGGLVSTRIYNVI